MRLNIWYLLVNLAWSEYYATVHRCNTSFWTSLSFRNRESHLSKLNQFIFKQLRHTKILTNCGCIFTTSSHFLAIFITYIAPVEFFITFCRRSFLGIKIWIITSRITVKLKWSSKGFKTCRLDWLHRCWWRMLKTKCVGDNFVMLVTVLAILVTNIQKMSPRS